MTTTTETVSLLEAVVPVLSAVFWPAVVVLALLLFRRPIGRILRSEDLALTLPGGIEVAAKRRAAAASSIAEAARRKSQTPLDTEQVLLETGLLDDVVNEYGAVRILWVDDLPTNNREERAALEKLGIVVELSVCTPQALSMLARSDFNLVISDMGRPEGSQAGYELLEKMRARGDNTSLLFYTSSRSAEHFSMAVSRGALGSTAEPGELIEMVMNALRAGRMRRGGVRIGIRNTLRRVRLR
jgi:CheY-like chemotaxis protein